MFGNNLLFTPEELEDIVIAMQEDIAALEEAVFELQHDKNSPSTK